MSNRLKSSLWLDAFRSRLGAKLIPFYVIKKGDPGAGTMFIRIDDNTLWSPEFDFETDARKWVVIAKDEAIAPYLERLNRTDPDYWLLDVDRGGEDVLFTDGL